MSRGSGSAAEPPGRVALSTASVYPESTATAFELATRLGYDAVEVMVGTDETSTEPAQVRHLSEYHALPVCAIHAPTLLLTQRVWGTEPWGKLERSAEMAHEVGAGTVVVHPPFRWQRDYARGFVEGIASLEERTGIVFAVENMYPWRASRREMEVYAPHWDPIGLEYAHTTLDVSHAATAREDCLDLARRMGPSLHHVHLTDGTGTAKDEHLIPGRGNQPVAGLLEHLATTGFSGHLVLEVNTRRSGGRSGRETDLIEGLAFARLHFAAPYAPDRSGDRRRELPG
ncbi:sugar phosphate isomerase/epimerase family protein [Nocardioides caldifontis]|uniref:sugar phosphate isomerase/epimerase family protein n=1 Tax=Nocardioides caldifontis TaxID=2588938 RepID=UPI0011E00B5A|nr:sugar phosphate isomerase/epimerase [Nocardioides caldifontis]